MKNGNARVLAIVLALASGGVLAQHKMEHMKDMPMPAAQGQAHHASGTVKKLDAAKGMVTLAHGPVKSLDWPAMTMGFQVRDKALLDKLAVGRQVEFDFVREGGGYMVTGVR